MRQFTFPIRAAIIAALLFILALPGAAQKRTVQSTPDDRVKNLKTLLSLTESQTTQVRDILTRSAATTSSTGSVNKRASAKLERTRNKEIDKQIEAILTPEQLVKYDAFKKARRTESKGYRKGKGSEYNF
jgi:Spy/CpxP family protein refolding chaperone